MGQDTYSDYDAEVQPEDQGQPEAYWRRRVITLCAGLALLGVLAWAFSGGGGKAPSTAQKGSQATGVLPAAAYSSPASSPTGASGSASASVGSAATLPFPAATSSRGGQPSGGKSARATASGAATGKAKAGNAAPSGVEPNGDCAPGSVVLSLFASRTAYYAGQYPAFQIDAVSTASRACAFDMSPHRLHVQVMSSGRIIWDSADCVRGEPNRVIELRRGVPAETSVTWRRIVSLPGCVTVASSARPGRYQAQAKNTSVASPVRSFRLVR